MDVRLRHSDRTPPTIQLPSWLVLILPLGACALSHRALDAGTRGDASGDARDARMDAMDVPVDAEPIDVPCVDVDLQTSVFHCGACGNGCVAPANADPACVNGTCGFTCRAGNHSCDGACVPDDSPASCGTSCAPCMPPTHAAATCVAGTCGFTCETGFHACGDVCVDDNSVAACGPSCTACTAPTGGTTACIGGACQSSCSAGAHACSGACVADSDANACGAACVVCAAPPNAIGACRSGACAFDCAAGYTLVGGACVSANCGNRRLDAGESCDDGNHAAGDGCGPACAMESGAITTRCSTTPTILIRAVGTYVYSGDTTGGANMLTDCSAGGGEQALSISIDVGRPFTASVTLHPTTSWRPVVRQGGDCGSLACIDSGSNGSDVSYTVPLLSPTSGQFVVDGRGGGGDRGPWVLTFVVN